MGGAPASQPPRPSHEYYYGVHYADCEHEVRPVTAGHRLVAVYSLCLRHKYHIPLMAPSVDTIQSLVQRVSTLDRCCGYILEHQYTSSSLSLLGLRALKGRDRAVADSLVLASAAMRQEDPGKGLVLHVARARRVINAHDDRYATSAADLELQLDVGEGGVFAADGSEPSPGGGALELLRGIRSVPDISLLVRSFPHGHLAIYITPDQSPW
jgi:hypothetical protein